MRRRRHSFAKITQVTMRRRVDASEGWDAVCQVKALSPPLDLGTFVVERVATPSGKPTRGMAQRIQKGMSRFLDSLTGKQFEERPH